jgi:hypothetical protein
MHGGRRVRLDAVMISVRSSEVPAPKAGDVVNITAGPALGRRYQLLDDSEPELDELGLEWTCEAERIDDR